MEESNSEQIVTIFAKDGEKKYPYTVIPTRINKILGFEHGDRVKAWVSEEGILCYQKIAGGNLPKPQKNNESQAAQTKNTKTDAKSKLFEKHKVF